MTARLSVNLAPAVALLTLFPAVTRAQAFQAFGVGDLAVSVQTNRATSSGGSGTLATLSSGAWQSFRLGVRGKLPVSDEAAAIYDAATTLGGSSGTILNTGSVDNSRFNAFRLFDRNLYAGVSTLDRGTLTAGRQATALAESLWVTDPLRANAGANNLNVRLGYLAAPGPALNTKFGPDAASNMSGNALDRQDNSLKYAYGRAGFVGIGMYSFGGVTGVGGRSNSWSALVGYDHALFGVRAAVAEFKDANAVALYAWTTGAVGKLGPVKLKATYSGNVVDDTATYGRLRTAVWSGGATWSATQKLDLTVAYYGARRTQQAAPLQLATKLYLLPEWYLNKSVSIYGLADYELFSGHGSALDTGTPLPAGTRNSLYLAVGLSFAFAS